MQTANGNIRGSSSSGALAPASTLAAGQNSSSVQDLASTATKPSKKLENSQLLTSQTQSRHPPLNPTFPFKRKHQYADPAPKIHLTRRPPKWQSPRSSQENAGVNELKRAKTSVPDLPAVPPEAQTEASPSHKTGLALGLHKDPYSPKKTRQIRQSKVDERCRRASRQAPSSVTCKALKHKWAKCGPDKGTKGPKTSREEAYEPQNQSKAGCLTATLTSDPRVKDSGKMNPDEKVQMLERAGKAKALVLTLVYRDGTTQLDPEQVSRDR